MHPVIVVTELRLLPPGERWQKLVAPLEAQLVASGLGRVLDFDVLQRETAEIGYCAAEEVAVEVTVALMHLGYLRDLVDSVIAAAGISPGSPVQPARWLGYHCDDYFSAGWAHQGHFDEPSQTPVIVPLADAYEDVEHQFLVVGHSGGDGIDFGYRHGHSGLWAYPIDGEFKIMANTVAELVEDWCSGRLSV
jgi:hypothetical protein